MEDYSVYTYLNALIDADVFEHGRKTFWDGADVIFVTPKRKEHDIEKVHNARESYERWEKTGSHKVVVTEHAPAVIALIEELKSIAQVDGLSKYEYYYSIADYVAKHDNVTDVKELLHGIVAMLKDNRNHWLDTPDKEYHVVNEWDGDKVKRAQMVADTEISAWFEYGVQNNDPFFAKFMALWVAFNKKYSEYKNQKYDLIRDGTPEKYDERTPIKYITSDPTDNARNRREQKATSYDCYCIGERYQITKFAVFNSEKLVTLYDDVFGKGLTRIFESDSVKSMRDGNNQKVSKAIYEDFKRSQENWIKKGVFEEKDKDFCYKFARTLALFQTLYTVRCNLFHGSKSTNNKRDIALIRTSATILQIYLQPFTPVFDNHKVKV